MCGLPFGIHLAVAFSSFLVYLELVVLIFLDYSRSLGPSDYAVFYLLFTAVFDLTLLFDTSGLPLAAVVLLVVMLGVKMGLVVVESRSKKTALREPWCNKAPEVLSGVISRLTFLWVQPIIISGRRLFKSLHLQNLPEIDEDLLAYALRRKAVFAWESRGMTSQRERRRQKN